MSRFEVRGLRLVILFVLALAAPAAAQIITVFDPPNSTGTGAEDIELKLKQELVLNGLRKNGFSERDKNEHKLHSST